MSPLDSLLRPDFTPLFSFDAQISAKHEANRFHVLQSGDDFWLRLEGHADWLGIFDNHCFQFRPAARSGDFEHLKVLLEIALNERCWGRAVSLPDLNDPARFWRVLWRGKKSWLMRPDTREVAAFTAPATWRRGAWIQPGAHFVRLLGREWRNPASDVAHARAFLDMDDDARADATRQWQCGSWAELRPLLRAVAILEHDGDDRELRVFYPVFQRRADAYHPGFPAPDSPRRLRLIERLSVHYCAVFLDAASVRAIATRPFSFQQGIRSWQHPQVEVPPPSQHERLEAHLFLRDWLREHAPDLLDEWAA